MNPRFLLLAAVSALLFASCAAPVTRRIEKNPQLYSALSDRHKAMVQRGQIEEGMTKEAVFLAWGKPERASKGTRNGKTVERWSYTAYNAVHTSSIGFGVGMGYGGFYGGPFYDTMFYREPVATYVPYEARWAEFVSGKVTAWSADRRP